MSDVIDRAMAAAAESAPTRVAWRKPSPHRRDRQSLAAGLRAHRSHRGRSGTHARVIHQHSSGSLTPCSTACGRPCVDTLQSASVVEAPYIQKDLVGPLRRGRNSLGLRSQLAVRLYLDARALCSD